MSITVDMKTSRNTNSLRLRVADFCVCVTLQISNYHSREWRHAKHGDTHNGVNVAVSRGVFLCIKESKKENGNPYLYQYTYVYCTSTHAGTVHICVFVSSSQAHIKIMGFSLWRDYCCCLMSPVLDKENTIKFAVVWCWATVCTMLWSVCIRHHFLYYPVCAIIRATFTPCCLPCLFPSCCNTLEISF